MTADYLSTLLRRSFNLAGSIRPRLPSVFEPSVIRKSPAEWDLNLESSENDQTSNRKMSDNLSEPSSVFELGEPWLRLPEEKKSISERSPERVTEAVAQPGRPRTLSPRARQAPSSITGKPPPLIKVDENPDLSVSNPVSWKAAVSAADSEEKELRQSHKVKTSEVESSIPFRGSPPKKSQQIQPVLREPLSQITEADETISVSTVSTADKTKTSQVPELQSKKSGIEGPRERLAVVAPQLEPKNEVPIPTIFRQHREKPQVMIGRIKVEVVQDRPKRDPVKVITVNPRGSSLQEKRSGGIQSKLRFGIGQM